VLLVWLFAVANATPPEPLHLEGILNGGDYDSLIQPLVLSLAGLPDTPVSLLTPLGLSLMRVSSRVSDDVLTAARPAAAPRAPPLP